jgi:hypothetical protein
MGTRSRSLCLCLVLGGAMTAGCSSTPSTPNEPDIDAAEHTLSSFLGMLADGEYAEASALYTGPLDSMQVWNPEIEAGDVAGLLAYGCGNRLLQCLPVRSLALAQTEASGELVFNVEFSLPDGTPFVRGACCGATSTEMPDQSEFPFRVQPKAGGGFAILDLPPYVP